MDKQIPPIPKSQHQYSPKLWYSSTNHLLSCHSPYVPIPPNWLLNFRINSGLDLFCIRTFSVPILESSITIDPYMLVPWCSPRKSPIALGWMRIMVSPSVHQLGEDDRDISSVMFFMYMQICITCFFLIEKLHICIWKQSIKHFGIRYLVGYTHKLRSRYHPAECSLTLEMNAFSISFARAFWNLSFNLRCSRAWARSAALILYHVLVLHIHMVSLSVRQFHPIITRIHGGRS